MDPIADRPLSTLLADVAQATPAPGGGSSAAVSCALAAALIEMTARFGAARREHEHADQMDHIADRASALRAEALDLAERELTSYAPVLEAMQLPTHDAIRTARLNDALSQAADAPLALAVVAAEVAALADKALGSDPGHLRGDALTGLLLAEAACQAAAGLVEINLAGRPEDPRRGELKTARERAHRARVRALGPD